MHRVTLHPARYIMWTAAALSACQGSADRAESKMSASSDESSSMASLTRDELLDPTACQACHPAQYEEWSGSMHAYASRDPVFIAMNARGQEETNGALGDFCVQCHAPMAVRDGLTSDGLNLRDLPARYQGVTCYFCHTVEAVVGDHNNALHIANDQVMRGPFADPFATSAHHSSYSTHFSASHSDSAALCGACHDVVVHDAFAPAQVAIERTYVEWKASLFNAPSANGGLTCNGCHMPVSPRRDQSASIEHAPKRRSRRHDFEGVDVAIDEFPGKTRQRLLVQQFLDSSLLAELCVSRDGIIAVTVENAGAGHHWPSGASHDRLAWLDIAAYDTGGLVYRSTEPEGTALAYLRQQTGALDGGIDDAAVAQSGTADSGATESDDGGEAAKSVDRVVEEAPTLTDTVINNDGETAHFFWDAAKISTSTTLPAVVTRDPLSPEFHRERRTWLIDAQQKDFNSLQRVELTIKLRPVKLAILAELVRTDHLDPALALAIPTFSLLPERCYTPDERQRFPDILLGAGADCDPTQPTHTTTLVWERTRATAEARNFRQTVIRSAPALCLAHPTYIPPP